MLAQLLKAPRRQKAMNAPTKSLLQRPAINAYLYSQDQSLSADTVHGCNFSVYQMGN